jgi:hypothetical protein
MGRMPVQRADVLAYIAVKGWTLDYFADWLLAQLTYGVPGYEIGTYTRTWQLVQEMAAEQERQDLTENYVTTAACPHCGSEPRITGGRNPVTYCPTCDARLVDVRRLDGRTFFRWSVPAQERQEQPLLVRLPQFTNVAG